MALGWGGLQTDYMRFPSNSGSHLGILFIFQVQPNKKAKHETIYQQVVVVTYEHIYSVTKKH